jgi:hypothetical protein
MHHFSWLSLLLHLVVCEVWNYGKKFVLAVVQAAALVYFFLVFLSFYACQPRPIAAQGIGCPVAP